MSSDLTARLAAMEAATMLRRIPDDSRDTATVDLTTNDYLGLAARADLQENFLADADNRRSPFTSSASRLLASHQADYAALESLLDSLGAPHGLRSLLFNSGYHANSGLVGAITRLFSRPLILADKLVHASIIDGIILSRTDFRRFPHNDFDRLEAMLQRTASTPERPDGVIIIVESVYSMDGDRADIDRFIDLKRRYSRADMEVMLYVDEAHAFGVEGPSGLGLVAASCEPAAVDVTVGTFGKALASSGAFAWMSPELREWAVNSARSFIFSTSMPPVTARYTRYMVETMLGMDSERGKLRRLCAILDPADCRYIYPAITGSACRAVELSHRLRDELGIKVLPIRTPTVPPGTERLRISLNATVDGDSLRSLRSFLDKNLQ
ncbi:MAG: aminotransferase class I/II-fold pyridoxal phosphate-dependent enzyme [Paramuribaculum sp.]|nr:aminotransferase class I/II-fold pyridoxal phosphate-dependent enzyme [Paramuribaculum sp.]MDE7152099.1 aminotransferase class I/II-fold pyridoxal phosphate-dependent enzyme [Candidatus Amulumruptor sp.]